MSVFLRKIHKEITPLLEKKEVLEWRSKYFDRSTRWDDGPCWTIAHYIRYYIGRGQVRILNSWHAVYVSNTKKKASYYMDGHGVHKVTEYTYLEPDHWINVTNYKTNNVPALNELLLIIPPPRKVIEPMSIH